MHAEKEGNKEQGSEDDKVDDNVTEEYRYRVRAKHEELSEEAEGLDGKKSLGKMKKLYVKEHQKRVHHRGIESRYGGQIK